MKLVSYVVKNDELNIRTADESSARLAWVDDEYVVDAVFAQKWTMETGGYSYPHWISSELLTVLERGPSELKILKEIRERIAGQDLKHLSVEGEPVALALDDVQILPPLPYPRSLRDFYAFEQHVETARSQRGLEMIPEWYQIPVFYFSNHQSIVGTDVAVRKPAYTEKLDFELEVACVIGKAGKNISEDMAMAHIAGLMIMNDWSARDVQQLEMKVGLGPAKGKDFATSLGPYLVTLDELEDRRKGDRWDLEMVARVNGKQISRGNLKDLYWTFSQMIERASEECELFPGDVIGSGTVGTGCILEIGVEECDWLRPGDCVELEVERLGVLQNQIDPSY